MQNLEQILKDLILKNYSVLEISKELKKPYTTIRAAIKRYDLKVTIKYASKKWNKDALDKLIKESISKSEVLRKLNILIRPGNSLN